MTYKFDLAFGHLLVALFIHPIFFQFGFLVGQLYNKIVLHKYAKNTNI
jgi:hypothetical protein